MTVTSLHIFSNDWHCMLGRVGNNILLSLEYPWLIYVVKPFSHEHVDDLILQSKLLLGVIYLSSIPFSCVIFAYYYFTLYISFISYRYGVSQTLFYWSTFIILIFFILCFCCCLLLKKNRESFYSNVAKVFLINFLLFWCWFYLDLLAPSLKE